MIEYVLLISTKAVTYASNHVIFSNSAHTAGGFGLALLLQHYLEGKAFLPPFLGWLLIAFALFFHGMALFSK